MKNEGKKLYHVNSRGDPTTNYIVDMELGTCSCDMGKNGSPCSHQAAIVFHFQVQSFNFVPVIQPSQRQEIAYLAIGDKVKRDIEFYSSLHQRKDETSIKTNPTNNFEATDNFTGSCWDLIREGALDDTGENLPAQILNSTKRADLVGKIDNMAGILKQKLDTNDPQLLAGIEKFLDRFQSLPSDARLASALHLFGSENRRGYSMSSGSRRWGKRIGVQSTASGRRKYGSRGKGQVIAGRPRMSYVKNNKQNSVKQRYKLPIRKKNQVEKKRPHNLSLNISKGKQNAGKW